MRAMPIHLWHQATINHMINHHEWQCMIILWGKWHDRDDRHIYTYEQRKSMISYIYPDLIIKWISDYDDNQARFDELDRITNQYNEWQDILYRWWSEEDTIYYTNVGRNTKIIDRTNIQITKPISATQVRKRIEEGLDLDGWIDPKIQKIVKELYSQNISII